jgi:hypothetical protein
MFIRHIFVSAYQLDCDKISLLIANRARASAL